MVAIVWQCVYAVFILWTSHSLREGLSCESRDVQEIVKELYLENVEDWEALAGWLRVNAKLIRENCAISTALGQCYRRKLVETYCYQRGGDSERVREDIRHVLESKMGIKKQGGHDEKEDSKYDLYYFLLSCGMAVLLGVVVLYYMYLKGRIHAEMDKSVIQRVLNLLLTTCFPVRRYAKFLKAVYSTCPVAKSDKFPPTPSKVFIKLALVKKEKVSRAQADVFTRLTLRGDIDQILGFKEPIEMDDILKSDDKVRLVVVEGAPGIGKSTLARELCRQWPTLESLKRFSLVVHHRLREEGVQSATDISDLFYHCDTQLSRHVGEEVVRREGDGVLFVFDGFDEFPSELREKSLVMDIISGSKLPKATVLVTSRPSASAQLQALGIGKHIEVVGFSEKEILEFAHSTLGDSFDDFRKYLFTNPVVKGMMYNPLNCAIVVGVYQDTYESGKPVPHTQTQLYTELTLSLLSRYLTAKGNPLASKLPDNLEDLPHDSDLYQQLVKVGKLAFEGNLREELIFKQLPEGCSDLGLLIEHTALYTRETTTYNFFHLTLQEYMSAFYISQLPADEQRTLFSQHNSTLTSMNVVRLSSLTSMGVVWRFVAGLTKMQNIGWEEFKRVEKFEYVEDDVVPIGPFLLQCLYEAQDVQSFKSVFDQSRVKIDLCDEVLNNYCLYALGYLVSVCSNTWIMTLKGIPREGLEMLCHGIKSIGYWSSMGSIEKLDLSDSIGIMSEGEHLLQIPHQILQHIKSLELMGCYIDQRGFENLAECIPYLHSLTSLDIGGSPGNDFVKLFQALKEHGKLQTLHINNISIGLDEVLALEDLIHSLYSLKKLNIGGPFIIVYADELLTTVLSPSSLNTVTISGCEHPLESIETINDNISSLSFEFENEYNSSSESLDNSSNDSLSTDDNIKPYWLPPPSPDPLDTGGTRLSHILRENTSLRELRLLIPLHKKEVYDITCSATHSHSLKRLVLSEKYHSHHFSESEKEALKPCVDFY